MLSSLFLVKTHDVKKAFVKVNFVARSVIRIDEVEANKRVMMTRQKILVGKSSEIALANKQKNKPCGGSIPPI